MKLNRFLTLSAMLALAAVSSLAQGQSPLGRIIGKVTDGMTKEPIVGANVVVAGTGLGSATDIEGRFDIRRVPLGTYAVRVSTIGYLATTVTDVVVGSAKPAELSVGLMENEIKIEGVEVTAGYFTKIPDTPLSTLVQTNEEIRRLPGGLEDVARAIAILPGVAQVDGGRNDLIVRGGAPSENLFVIDNIEVPNINHFGTQGASGGPLSFINLDFVDNTSFSTGGFGARYGDKLSSVLNISLREGRKDGIGGKATISASQFGLNLEGPAGSDVNTLFSARRSYLDFIFKAAGFGFVPEYWDFLSKTSIRLGSKDQLNILAIAALDNVKYFNDTENKRFENSRVLGSDQNQIVGGVSWQHLFEKGYSTVSVGQSYVDYHFRQSDSTLVRIFSNQSLEYESSIRGDVFVHLFKSTELLTGVQAKLVDFSADIFLRPFETRFGDSLSVDARFKTTGFKGSAYAQLSRVFGKSRLTVGGRFDYFDLIDKYIFSPRVSYTAALSPATNLNWSIGRYAQAPSYIWLAANAQNRSLEFIDVIQYVLGVDHMLRADTRISLEGYIKTYSDYPASLVRPYLVLANTGAGFGGSEDGFSSFGLDPLVS
ncbi:MAG: TonB-dependent receptor, partial [Ignavibacteria bacterium GWA2_54_16]